MDNIKMKKYEQDRTIVEQLPSFTKEEMKEIKEDIINFLKEKPNMNKIMLLSNDINYYTIFERQVMTTTNYAGEKLLEFLTTDSFLSSLGELKVCKRTPQNDAMEIWIGKTYFLLFPADSFFVPL